VRPGVQQDLKNRGTLLKALRGKVDVFDNPPNLPERRDTEITVDMSPAQQNVYKYIEGSIPSYLKWKIRMNLPPSKAEAQALNAFSAGLRQSSNTPGPYTAGMSHLQAAEASPKMLSAFKAIQDRTKKDPNFKGLVYSNYMDAGVLPMASLLNRSGVPHAVYHGGLSAEQKHRIVEDYNTGKLKVILGTSAATEGLNLKGTKLIQVMEPHFNESKTEQVIARGIRIGSHAHLPPEERNVSVERYFSKPRQGFVSRLFSGKRTGIDEYIRQRALDKRRLADQIKAVFEEAQGAR
jgi:SNF2 family DNA or RNA helicase